MKALKVFTTYDLRFAIATLRDYQLLRTWSFLKIKTPCFLLLSFILLPAFLPAQFGRVTENDVQLQEVFIEATRERLLGNYKKAVELYASIIKQDDTNAAANYEIARVYNALNQNEKAVKHAEAAVALDGENVWFQIFLADVFQKTGEDKSAADVYKTLVNLEPNNEDFYFKWAYFLVRANEPDEAIKAYESLEKRIGINEELSRRKHNLYLGIGNYKKAAKEINALIDRFPTKVDYRQLLASFYEQTNQESKAKEVYAEILKMDPGNARANIAFAEGNKEAGGDIRFLNSLKPVFEKPDVHIDVKISELLPYLTKVADTGDKELANAAIELTSILTRVHSNEAKAFSAYGDLLYYAGRKEEAIEKYKETLELNESVYLVWEQLLYTYAELENYTQLAKDSENAMDIFPNQATIYYLNGLANYQLEKHQDALSTLQQASLMAGKNAQLAFQISSLLGSVYYQLKQYPNSDKAFEAALQLNPNDPSILNQYSYLLSLRNEQLGKAKEMAALTNELAPNQAKYQHTYGWVLYKMKEYKGAKDWIGRAIEKDNTDPTILEHYGDVVFQLGEQEEAVRYWQQAIDNGGKSELLDKKVSEGKMFE